MILGKLLVPPEEKEVSGEERGGIFPIHLPLISISENFSPFRTQLAFHLLHTAHLERLSSPCFLPLIAFKTLPVYASHSCP